MTVALIDVDGVVADFLGTLLVDIRSEVKVDGITKWNFMEFLSDSEKHAAMAYLDDADWWTTLRMKDGALWGLRVLHQDYNVKFVTSPWYKREPNGAKVILKGWAWARTKWLSDLFDVDVKNITITDNKQDVRGDYFLDDKKEHVARWQAMNMTKRARLFDAPYNQDAINLRRVTWDDVIEKGPV